ncbi:hypothetical protein IU479_32455 [Nocardia abscessus]|uniref:DUF6603 domain-containing protein n=1 Tax=Nocardia abscessus TaxID=120957 RepID=UPI001895C25B|nr:DUF6603 domain-containing protein [Nocardia abscessus]MBF6222799.1 hypothetical protein [Nocardia abscessus]
MSNAGPIETFVRALGAALSPLAQRLAGDGAEQVLEEIGLRLPNGTLAGGAVAGALQSAAGACGQLPQAVAALTDAIEADDDTAMIIAAAGLARLNAQVGVAFGRLGSALDGAVQSAAGLTPAQRVRLSAIARAAPERLIHRALVSYVADRLPGIKGVLEISGVLDDSAVPGDPADPSIPPHHFARLRADRLGTLLRSPAEHLEQLYGFGRADFDGLELFRRLQAVLDRPDATPILLTAPGMPAALEAFLFRVAVEPGPLPGLRIRLRTTAAKDIDVEEPVAGPWSSTMRSTSRFESGIELVLHPENGMRLESPAAAASLTLAAGTEAGGADGKPMILIGQAKGSRLEVERFAARVPLQLSAAAGASSPTVQLGAELEARRCKLVIDASKADGFIATVLGGIRVESDFDLTALYDNRKGLRFIGSATIEVAIPVHAELGPVEIPTIYLIGGLRDSTIPIEFSADIGAHLGPLASTVNRLGALATISFPDKGGNAGPAQIDTAFKAPNGVGLAVNAGIVSGGGFLYTDSTRGEYAGELELTFAKFLTLKAIGIITTRMPDGTAGFSLLIIITAEFGTGLQLGLGFTLLAVGGLLGLNRTMRLDAIAEGIRTGAIESVMFPSNIVANAPRIISDLRVFFPPRPGTFLIGPMAKLGWGTPALVTLSLSVIIEIPGNVAIVGVLRVALPAENVAVVVLQVNFVGALEFDRKRAWFFASLYDSRVLFITIDGEMGLLIAVGDDANFVLAVGGFHPRYTPPPLPFPNPRRIAIEIVNTSVARIRAEGYFATTTNSIQFGSRAEAFFGFSALNVSGHIAFDALVQISPFYFVVDFSSHFSVRVFGIGVWGLRIRLEVEGPTPWHARGSAGISLLFFDIDVDIDVGWGERRDTSLPPIRVLPALTAELSKPESWRALPPPGANLLVALRKLPEPDSRTVLHPVGSLRISQRLAPLDAKLVRIGARKPEDGTQFTLTASSPAFTKCGDVNELFAPGQFENLSDEERMSRTFEDRHGGIDLCPAGAQLTSAAAITRVARYEVITVDTNARRHRFRYLRQALALFTHLLSGSAVARSLLSTKVRTARVPVTDGVLGKTEGFAVALQANNTRFAAAPASFSSEGAALDWLASAIAGDRGLAGKLHVLPRFELAS